VRRWQRRRRSKIANTRGLALRVLAAHLSGKQRDDVVGEALAATRAIGSEDKRAEALRELAAHLSREQLGSWRRRRRLVTSLHGLKR
jgi:hypothetical protein